MYYFLLVSCLWFQTLHRLNEDLVFHLEITSTVERHVVIGIGIECRYASREKISALELVFGFGGALSTYVGFIIGIRVKVCTVSSKFIIVSVHLKLQLVY